MELNDLIKIVLVGDYSILRNALRMLLETEQSFQVIGEVSSISEISELIGDQQPDLILIDSPENGDKLDLFPYLKQMASKTPILILTASNDDQIYEKCLRLGINGLVVKDNSAETLFKAIKKVYQGDFWFDRALMGKTIRQLVSEKQLLHEHPKVAAHDGITERENQVINLICKGMKNKDIADKLFITETTVRHHLSAIFEKLSISNRVELVIYAFKNSLVKLPVESDAFINNRRSSEKLAI